MTEKNPIISFQSVEDQISKDYVRNREVRNRYEATPQFQEDQQKEVLRKDTASFKEQETNALANNQQSNFSATSLREQSATQAKQEKPVEKPDTLVNKIDEGLAETGEFVKNVGIGGVKSLEETLQTIGFKDNLFNIADAEDTADKIARGLGQGFTFFLPASAAVRGGLKLAKLFQKNEKLSKAGELVAGAAAGALTDVMAFDPKDPNPADLALAIGVISKDSKVGAAVKEWLAQKDTDSELVARTKAGITGLFAGALVDLLIRGAGYVRKSFKETEELEEAAQEFAEYAVDGVDRIKNGAEPEKLEEISKLLPDPDEGLAISQIRAKDDYAEALENFEETGGGYGKFKYGSGKSKEETGGKSGGSKEGSEGLPQPIADMLNKLANGETIPDQDLAEIVSVNLLKSSESHNIRNVIQFISRHIKIKDITKEPRPLESYDSVIGDMVDDFITTTGEGKSIILGDMKRVTSNIEEARSYVGTIKALIAVQTKTIAKLNTVFANAPTKANQDALMKAWDVEKELLFNGSGMSKASSDLLSAYKKTVRAIDDEAVIQKELQRKVISPDSEVLKIRSVYASKMDRMHKLKIDDLKAEVLDKSPDVKLDEAFDEAVEVTGKVGQKNRKGKSTGRKRSIKINKLETDTGKRVAKRLDSLEKLRKSARNPERGSVKPKNKPLKDVASPAQLKAIAKAKEDLNKIRLDRDTLTKKFQRNNKEQLRLRKHFEKLSKDIKDLQDGIDPRAPKGSKKGTTVDIETLKGEKARLLAKLKPFNEVEKRIEALTNTLELLIRKRMSKDWDTATPIERTQIEKDIQVSIQWNRDKLKTSRIESEVRDLFKLKAQGEELKDIDNMAFRQMKQRLANMDRGLPEKLIRVQSEIYVNGLLSSPKTILLVNTIGTSSAIISTIVERAFAGLKTAVTGKGDIDLQEAGILAWNYLANIPDAFRLGGKALYHGPSDPNFKADYMNVRDQAISKEAFNLGGNLGKTVDYIGSVTNMPGRLLLSTDEAYKGLIDRAEQAALSHRKARSEIRADGTETSYAAIAKRSQEITDNINAHPDIIEQARHAADVNTFTNPLHDVEVIDAFGKSVPKSSVAKSLKGFIDSDKTGILRTFIPFFQTPANIFNFTFERTPAIQMLSETLKQDLKSPNLGVREAAQARIGTSFTIWGGLFAYAYSGNFTGPPPKDNNLRKNLEASMGGRPWFSVNIGEGFQTYDKFDPFGLILGIAATSANMVKASQNLAGQYEKGDDSDAIFEKYGEVLWSSVVGMSELIKNKHFFNGLSDFMEALSTDGSQFDATVRKVVTAIDPRLSFYSSMRRNIARGLDPTKPEKLQKVKRERTESEELFETLAKDLLSEVSRVYEEANDAVMFGWGNRFAMKDLAGNTVEYPGTNSALSITSNIVNSMVNPSPTLKKSSSNLINRLAELESSIGQPSALKTVHGVTLTDEEKSWIINKWTTENKLLDNVVMKKGFLKSPEGLQLTLIENTIKENKEDAIKDALIKFPRLYKASADLKINMMETLTTKQRPTGYQFPN